MRFQSHSRLPRRTRCPNRVPWRPTRLSARARSSLVGAAPWYLVAIAGKDGESSGSAQGLCETGRSPLTEVPPMKPVSIHPLSALAGAGLLGLWILAVGAQSQIQVRPCRGLVSVADIPDPRQMVVIKEGTPFVVPAGKILAITALGGTGQGTISTIWVDDTPE